jgi:hypothetical protein
LILGIASINILCRGLSSKRTARENKGVEKKLFIY